MTEFTVAVLRNPTEHKIRLNQVTKWEEHTSREGPARITKRRRCGPCWPAKPDFCRLDALNIFDVLCFVLYSADGIVRKIGKLPLDDHHESDHSKIEWTDTTWNPLLGCTKISPGCKHCYAEAFAERFRGVPGHPYEQGFDLRLLPEKLSEPFYWPDPAPSSSTA